MFAIHETSIEYQTDDENPQKRRKVKTSPETISDYYNYWCEVCLCKVESIQSKFKIGDPGKIVEIDEAKFGNRKYSRGRVVEGQWVFGGTFS